MAHRYFFLYMLQIKNFYRSLYQHWRISAPGICKSKMSCFTQFFWWWNSLTERVDYTQLRDSKLVPKSWQDLVHNHTPSTKTMIWGQIQSIPTHFSEGVCSRLSQCCLVTCNRQKHTFIICKVWMPKTKNCISWCGCMK